MNCSFNLVPVIIVMAVTVHSYQVLSMCRGVFSEVLSNLIFTKLSNRYCFMFSLHVKKTRHKEVTYVAQVTQQVSGRAAMWTQVVAPFATM